MRLRDVILGLWAAVAGTGCGRSGAIPVTIGGSRWVFAPGESRLFAYGGGAGVSAWDIAGKRAMWQRSFAVNEWMTLSPTGETLAVVSQVSDGADVRFTVLNAADGTTIKDHVLTAPWRHSYETDESGFVALSFDGSWAAHALGDASGPASLCLEPIAGGADVWFSERGNTVRKLAFDPKALRIAVSWKAAPYWLDLYAHAGGQWQRVKRWEGAACPAWTARGLSFAAADGVHLLEGDRDAVVVRGGDFFGKAGDACDSWQLSPDGGWLLSWHEWSLRVVSARTGATVMSHEWEKKEASGVCASGFSGHRLRAFTCSGLLLEFDLSKPALTKTEDFGAPFASHESHFGEGRSRMPLYQATLSPSGDWFLLRKTSGEVKLYKL